MANTEPRGMRDEANVGPDPRQARNLIPMRELKNFKVADGEPDIRGWHVFSSTGRELGIVQDLLVDTSANEVVMLDIDLRRNDRHTLAPIRAAWIDRRYQRVVIDSKALDADETVPALPRRGTVSDDEVRTFDERYQRAYGDRGYEADREYRVRRERDELRFGRRSANLGAAAAGTAAGTAAAGAANVARKADAAADRAADRRDFDRDRGDRDAEARTLPATGGVEPDTLDAQTRAGITAHPHGDRYLSSADRVVERHTVVDDDAARAARQLDTSATSGTSTASGTSGTSSAGQVRFPRAAEDESDERRRVILEEVVVRRRAVDPSELTPAERAQLASDPNATIRRDV